MLIHHTKIYPRKKFDLRCLLNFLALLILLPSPVNAQVAGGGIQPQFQGPPATFTITGSTSVAQGVTSSVYSTSITTLPAGTSILWSLSATAGTVTGFGTTSLTINWDPQFSGNLVINCTETNSYGTASSPAVTVSKAPNLSVNPTSINANYNRSPGAITITSATTGNTFQWQSSPDGSSWANISGATGTSYTVPALTASIYYRVQAINSSGTFLSDVIPVTVSHLLTAGTISLTQNVNNGGRIVLDATAATYGTTPYTYQWMSSTDGVNYSNISGATSLSYLRTIQTTTTYYEIVVRDAVGAMDTSYPFTVTIYPTLVSGTVSPGAQTLNHGVVPAALTCTAASGGDGTYTYQWKSSADNLSFTNIAGATALTYTFPAALNATGYYELVTTDVGSTSTVTSNVATITVYPQLVPGTISPSNRTVSTGTSPGMLTGTLATGGSGSYTYLWQSSPDNSNWVTATGTGTTTLNYTPGPITATVYYRLWYTSNGLTVYSNVSTIWIGSCLALGTNPGSTLNYTITDIFRTPGITSTSQTQVAAMTSCDVNQTIQYFDGLGRPLQTVQVKGSPAGSDEVQPFGYDVLGREVAKYLPYAFQGTANGSYKADALTTDATSQSTFYNSPPAGVAAVTNSAHANTNFEPSPINRVIEQGAPGIPWQLGSGHTVTIAYSANVANSVINWKVNTGTGAGATGGTTFYSANTLLVTTTTDEDAKSTTEFKDILGRVICKRAANGASTYYVYDDFNNLAYVIPPLVSYPANFIETDAVFTGFIYGYHYDARHRLVEKKIPGKDWEYLLYNDLDKVVGTQDGVQRQKVPQEWTFTKYDVMGRPVITGVVTYGTAAGTNYRATFQQSGVNAVTTLWEKPITTGIGYSASAWPLTWTGVTLSTDYYDTYTGIPSFPSNYTAPAGSSAMTRGLPTVSKTNVLGSADMLWTVDYYDDLARPVQIYKQHYLGGTLNVYNFDTFNSSYNFANQVVSATRRHYSGTSGNLVINIADTYTYDNEGRKTQTWEKMNAGTHVLLSQLSYNEIGQPYQKKLHSENNGASFLETITETYNQRGWLTETGSANFDEKLYYNAPSGTITGLTGLYNGNILEAWYNSPNVANKGFAYTYDNLNRLTASKYYASSTYSGTMDEAMSYDLLGNITQLVRGNSGTQPYTYSGTFTYPSYTGNRVNTVLNNGAAYRTYTYDQNGNTSTAGTFTYDYNILNLPNDVKSGGTIFNTYTYAADGEKLRKVSTQSGNTDYISGIQYKNGTIDFIQTEEGRYENSTSAYLYELKDHLGNVRVIIQKNTATTATVDEENEYYAFGLNVNRIENGIANKYLYNRKELQDESSLNVYDYGARLYDPVVARWTTIDPLAELSRRWSPFDYGMNNPVRNIDPDGRYSGDPNANNDNYNSWTESTDETYNNIKKGVAADAAQTAANSTMPAYAGNNSGGIELAPGANGVGFKDYIILPVYNGDPYGGMLDVVKVTPNSGDYGFLGLNNNRGMNYNLYMSTVDEDKAAAYILLSLVAPEIGGELIAPVAQSVRALFEGEEIGVVTGLERARQLGTAGEEAVGITGPKTAVNVSGRTRIPDRLTETTIEEVKNVVHQNFTRQLRDFYQYSQDNELQMILHTRSSTTFSGPLQQLIDNGFILQKIIPKL